MRPYPAYKDSGVEWLGEVPEGWEVKRLRRVVALNPSKAESNWLDAEAEVSFIPMEAVGENGEIDLSRTRPVGEVENGYTYFRNGDMTFAKITPCFENGKRALMRDLKGGIGFGTTELTVLRAEPSQTTPEFLFWLLSTPEFRKTGEAHMYGAGGQKRVPDDFVREFAAPLPPLPEQQSIARFLDKEVAKIDALVAEQRRLIALLAEKRQAVISHAVTKGLNPATPLKPSGIDWLGDIPEGWEVVQAGRVASVLSGFAFPSDGFSHDAADTPLLRGVNIGVGELRWDDVVYWCRSSDDRLSPFEVKVGDIVIGMDRPWISAGLRIAEVREKDLPCLLLQRVGLIRTSQLLNPRFLLLQYSGSNFRDFLAPEMTGVSVPHISPSQITSFPITLPAREEQDAIIAFLDAQTIQFDALTAAATSAISLLQERRAALISAAVTGKIDLRAHFAPSLSEPETA